MYNPRQDASDVIAYLHTKDDRCPDVWARLAGEPDVALSYLGTTSDYSESSFVALLERSEFAIDLDADR